MITANAAREIMIGKYSPEKENNICLHSNWDLLEHLIIVASKYKKHELFHLLSIKELGEVMDNGYSISLASEPTDAEFRMYKISW